MAGTRRGSGSAGNHYRVGCGGRHSCGRGRRKPSRACRIKTGSLEEREAPNEEGEEIESPKRNVIQAESGETQDYVTEAKSMEHEEEEESRAEHGERSAKASVSLWKSLSYWQLAFKVVSEGDEAYTTNLCQMCFNKHLQAKREEPLTNVMERQVVKIRCIAEGCGKEWGKNHVCVGRENIFSQQDAEHRGSECWLTKKSRQEYKVGSSRNRQPKSTWSK